MDIYRKYRNFGFLGIFILFVLCVSFNNNIVIIISSVLITLWIFGLIPMVIIGRKREHKAEKNFNKLVELELQEKLENQKIKDSKNNNK